MDRMPKENLRLFGEQTIAVELIAGRAMSMKYNLNSVSPSGKF